MSKAPLRVPIEGLAPGDHALPADAATYVTRVHRLGAGDRLVLFDPERAIEADAEIADAGKRAVLVRVGEVRAAARAARAITLIQGIGKGDKMDAVVRDATELGVTRVVPAIGERSVSRPEAARAERWRRIAIEAARQCGRGDAPVIEAPQSFEAAVRGAGEGGRICMDPRAEVLLGAAIARFDAALPIAIAVGPEGGLTSEELTAAERAGFVRVTLGPLILRTETVCAAVLGAILAHGHRAQ